MKEEFNSSEDHVSLFDLVNKEQLLHLALEVLNNDDIDDEYKEIAASITHWYILNEIIKTQETFTEEDINDRFNELITNHVINGLVRKGFLEENLPEDGECESTFNITDAGRKLFHGKLGNY